MGRVTKYVLFTLIICVLLFKNIHGLEPLENVNNFNFSAIIKMCF